MLKQGKGLWKQLDSSNKREYVMLTGENGMNEMFHTMEVQFTYQRLEKLAGISLVERNRLKSMIGSPDRENLTIAKLIMDQYEKR